MKRLIVMLLAGCMLLYACDFSSLSPTADPTLTQPPTTQSTDPASTTEPTDPVPRYAHPLTGEPLDEPFTGRCVAVIINNIRQAQPLYGIGDADILYETIAEGGGTITRCLAVYSDISQAKKIGSIRSARTYLVDLARAHNAVLIHCGGSDYSLDELKELNYDAINEFYNGKYFYRDQERYAAGYAWEHTLFSDGVTLLDGIEKKGFSMTASYEPLLVPAFAQDAAPEEGTPALTVTVRFFKNGKETSMRYDEKTGCYYGEQRWKVDGEYAYAATLQDASTEEAVGYRNVLALFVKTTSNGYRMFTEQTGSGDGYFACGGKIVPIRWHRESLDDPFTYTLTDGSPLILGIGKTYAAILPIGSPVEAQ